MRRHIRLVATALLISVFLFGITSTTPRVYGAATPCLSTLKCAIAILSPGSGAVLNKNQTVNPSFLVSFLVHNFTLVQPGTNNDVNTTTANPGAHNEGHIHVFVDSVYVTIWASVNGIPLTLFPGTHVVRLDLVNDFHQEFSPGINASTTVNVVDPLQTTATSAQNNASNAMLFSLGALIVSIATLILVAYAAFWQKPKTS